MVVRFVGCVALTLMSSGCLTTAEWVRDEIGPAQCTWQRQDAAYRLSDAISRPERFRPAVRPRGDEWSVWTVDEADPPRLRRHDLVAGAVSDPESPTCSPTDRGVWWLCPEDDAQTLATWSPMASGPPEVSVIDAGEAWRHFHDKTHAGLAMTVLPDAASSIGGRVFYVEDDGVHLGQPADPGQDRATIALPPGVSLQDPVIAREDDEYCMVSVDVGMPDDRLTAFTVPVRDDDAAPIAEQHAIPSEPRCRRPALQRINAGWMVACDHFDDEAVAVYVSPDCRTWQRIEGLPAEVVALDAPPDDPTEPEVPDAPFIAPAIGDGAVVAWPQADGIMLARFDGAGRLQEWIIEPVQGRPLGVALGARVSEPAGDGSAESAYLVAYSTRDDFEPRFAEYRLSCGRE